MPHSIYPAAKALICDDARFLAIRQAVGDYSFWDLPGGRMLYDEMPEETLVREVKEETNLDVIIEGIAGVWWFFRLYDSDQAICITYRCRGSNLEDIDLSKNPDKNELIEEYAWVTKEEFLDGNFPVAHDSLKEFIQKIFEK